MSEIAILNPQPRQMIQVIDPIPVLDTARFEQMQRIARVMATTSMCPEALRCIRDGDKVTDLHPDTVVANCFMVVNQAVRWGMDPFAVAQSVSIVRGKLCYEGKLVAAVIDAKLGVRLFYDWDDKTGDAAGIVVSGTLPGETTPRTISGTVGDWKTTGRGSPWTTPLSCRRQLAYRGSREWGRIHAPAIMLGVYTSDEMDAIASESHRNADARRDQGSIDITPSRRIAPPPPPPPPPGPQKADVGAAKTETAAAPTAGPPGPPPPPPGKTDATKLPPPPPAAAGSAKPSGFDFEGLRTELRAAPNEAAADDIYDRLVNQRSRHMSEAELDECDNIMREVCARFGGPEE